jgi:hypothetical protein
LEFSAEEFEVASVGGHDRRSAATRCEGDQGVILKISLLAAFPPLCIPDLSDEPPRLPPLCRPQIQGLPDEALEGRLYGRPGVRASGSARHPTALGWVRWRPSDYPCGRSGEPLQSQEKLVGGVGRVVHLLRSDDFGAR